MTAVQWRIDRNGGKAHTAALAGACAKALFVPLLPTPTISQSRARASEILSSAALNGAKPSAGPKWRAVTPPAPGFGSLLCTLLWSSRGAFEVGSGGVIWADPLLAVTESLFFL
eukprot:6191132-Pleurochrysis_carterae.AAC.2